MTQDDTLFRHIRRWERPGGLLLADPPDEVKDIHELCAWMWDLVRADRHAIRREARLTATEWTAWNWAMQGKTPPEYASYMRITVRQAQRIQRSAVLKVAATPTIGALTVYLEEVRRHGYRTPRQDSLHIVR